MRAQYQPGKAYWQEIAELDQTILTYRASTIRRVAGAMLLQRRVNWTSEGARYIFSSGKLFGIHVGATIKELKQADDTPTIGSESQRLSRQVSFVPSGIFAYPNHSVKDYHYRLAMSEGEASADRISGVELTKLRFHAAQIRHEQNRSGASLPTEETYQFILTAMQQGLEVLTSGHQDKAP